MNNVRCLKCDDEDVYISINQSYQHLSYYGCRNCNWWMKMDAYKKIIREISQKALEEVLEESWVE